MAEFSSSLCLFLGFMFLWKMLYKFHSFIFCKIPNFIDQNRIKCYHRYVLNGLTLTSSVSFTRRICSRRSCRSLNVDCAVMEYTKAKPWPFFMYRSLIAVNCSYRNDNGGERPSANLFDIHRVRRVLWHPCLTWLTVPAVSRISSIHCCPSTSTCCRRKTNRFIFVYRSCWLIKFRRFNEVCVKSVCVCSPFCRSLLLWGHTSPQKCLAQIGLSETDKRSRGKHQDKILLLVATSSKTIS